MVAVCVSNLHVPLPPRGPNFSSIQGERKMEEPLYAELQREVQRKLGRCLIRIQQYELLLKEMLAKREVSLQTGRKGLVPEDSESNFKTLGQLAGELTDEYFQPTHHRCWNTSTGEIDRRGRAAPGFNPPTFQRFNGPRSARQDG